MRTTITFDDDVYEIVSLYASGRGITLGDAIGELVRKAAPGSTPKSTGIKTAPNGLRIFAPRNRAITPEMVKAAQEDEVA